MIEIHNVPSDIVLRLAKRAVELTEADSSVNSAKFFRFAINTPTLVVRLYRQTEDQSLRSQCLDLLDQMLALGWNEAAAEMAKAES